MVVVPGWGRGTTSECLMPELLPALEPGGSDGFTAARILLVLLSCVLTFQSKSLSEALVLLGTGAGACHWFTDILSVRGESAGFRLSSTFSC